MPATLACGFVASQLEVDFLPVCCYAAGGFGESMSPANLTDDAALLRATANGDKATFQQLYERHAGVLFGLALKILNDRSDAEDVLQEVFVQIWKNAGSYDERRGKPLGWLIMLTRSRAIDRMRSRQTRARATEAAGHEPSEEMPSPGQDAGAAETRSLVQRAVQGLPAEQRTPIELAYFGGFTQTEIAARLGEPLGTVKTRIRTGMLRLREQLGGAS